MSFFGAFLNSLGLRTPAKRKREEPTSIEEQCQPSAARLRVSIDEPQRPCPEQHSSLQQEVDTPPYAKQTQAAADSPAPLQQPFWRAATPRLTLSPQLFTFGRHQRDTGTAQLDSIFPSSPVPCQRAYGNRLNSTLANGAPAVPSQWQRQTLLKRYMGGTSPALDRQRVSTTALQAGMSNGLQVHGPSSSANQAVQGRSISSRSQKHAQGSHADIEAAALQKLSRANQMELEAEHELELRKKQAERVRAEALADLSTANQERASAGFGNVAASAVKPWHAELSRFVAALDPPYRQGTLQASRTQAGPIAPAASLVPYDASPAPPSQPQQQRPGSSRAAIAPAPPGAGARWRQPSFSPSAPIYPRVQLGLDDERHSPAAQPDGGAGGAADGGEQLRRLKQAAAASSRRATEAQQALDQLMQGLDSRLSLRSAEAQDNSMRKEIRAQDDALRWRQAQTQAALQRFSRSAPDSPAAPYQAAPADDSDRGQEAASCSQTSAGDEDDGVLELSSDSEQADGGPLQAGPSQSASTSREEEEELSSALQEASVSEADSVPGEAPFGKMPPLTAHQKAQAKKALAPGNVHEVLVSHKTSNIDITRDIIACLMSEGWLNDEVINVYMGLLQERDTRWRAGGAYPKCHFFNSFFINKLFTDAHAYEYKSVRRWTLAKRLAAWGQASASILDCDKIIIPVHLGNHWTCAVIDVPNRSIIYLDSYKHERRDIMGALAQYMVHEFADKADVKMEASDWTLVAPKHIPQQRNGFDCGVFAVQYAEYHARNAALSFSGRDMEYFRVKMLADIMDLRVE